MDEHDATLTLPEAGGPFSVGLLFLSIVMAIVGLTLPSEVKQEAEAPPASAAPAAGVIGQPNRLVVPSLRLNVPVIPIEMDPRGVLSPPADVNTVGWWQRSARPGAKQGQTLVTGHSVRVGDGAMDRLGDLRPGARVSLGAGGRQTTYEATKVFVYSREQVARHAYDLFGQDRGDGRLVLVTCTDWDGDSYASNIIVFARPVRPA